MKISKIKGIHNLLNKKSKSKNNIGKPQISIDEIIKNLNFACIGVPFKVLCLEWATAFSILASHNGYKCKFCIGVQNKPFCAHAWVEFKNKVINDYPDLKKSLSIIYSKEL